LTTGDQRLITGYAALTTGDQRLITGNAALTKGDQRLITGNAALTKGDQRLITALAKIISLTPVPASVSLVWFTTASLWLAKPEAL